MGSTSSRVSVPIGCKAGIAKRMAQTIGICWRRNTTRCKMHAASSL